MTSGDDSALVSMRFYVDRSVSASRMRVLALEPTAVFIRSAPRMLENSAMIADRGLDSTVFLATATSARTHFSRLVTA